MKRTLLTAVIGGAIALMSGVFTAQAAPLSAMKTVQADASITQTVGHRYNHRRHYQPRRHYYRPHVRWHSPRYYRPYYVAPRYYYGGPRRHWTHRYHRRHYR